MRTVIAMVAMSAFYLCFILVRSRRKCAGNCGSCHTACHDAPLPEDSHDVTPV